MGDDTSCVCVCVCECLEKLKQRSWLCVSALLFSIQLGSDVNLFEMNSIQNVDFYSGWLMKPDINVGDCSTFGNTWRSPLHRAVIMKQCIPASLMLKVRLWRMSVFEHVCSLCNLHNANVKLVLQSSVLTGTKLIFDNWLLISFFLFFFTPLSRPVFAPMISLCAYKVSFLFPRMALHKPIIFLHIVSTQKLNVLKQSCRITFLYTLYTCGHRICLFDYWNIKVQYKWLCWVIAANVSQKAVK